MDGHQPVRAAFDVEQYRGLVQEGPCLVCAFLTGHPVEPSSKVHKPDGPGGGHRRSGV
jgi:hypothetical protein